MRAFLGRRAVKMKYLARVRRHQMFDQIQHGFYWEKGKGCAVGCTIHSGNHAAYETELGIPQMIARLEDTIFEGLTNGRSKKWPARFLSAIRVGADLSLVGPQFLLALVERRYALLDKGGRATVGSAMQQVIAVLRTWAETGVADYSAASSVADSAASAASYAAYSVADSAASSAASYAARSAASAADSAARSAASYAASAASYAAYSAVDSAASAARGDEYVWQAETLLALLRKAPVRSGE
jgi:hypothetical protein